MSRLFDALQMSIGGKSDVPFFQATSLEAELLQSADPENGMLGQVPSVKIANGGSKLVSMDPEQSLAAEKFRFLAVRLRYIQQKHPLKKVLVTSALSEEGKSFTSANLAITLARKERQKVLLIEGDLRRPVIAHQFGLHHLPGLSESLANGSNGLTNLVYLEEPKLWFMPAGASAENALELLQSPRLSAQMNQMNTWFDWVIIDSPPLLPLADSTVWSRYSDGVLLITREGRTQREALKRGLEVLSKTNLIGVVFNSCSDVDQNNYYQKYSPSLSVKVERQS